MNDNRHAGLNVSILLHAAAFISHLQWTAPTFLSVKYNITQPPLTYPTITTLNYRSSDATRLTTSAARPPTRPRWRGIRVRRRRTCVGVRRRGDFWRSGRSTWTVRTQPCGRGRRSGGSVWRVVVNDAAARTQAWLHLSYARSRPSPPRPPPLALPAPPPGVAAPSSNNSPNPTISIDISSRSFVRPARDRNAARSDCTERSYQTGALRLNHAIGQS